MNHAVVQSRSPHGNVAGDSHFQPNAMPNDLSLKIPLCERRPKKEVPTATWREVHTFNLTISSAQTTCAVERKIGSPDHDCRDRNQVGPRLDANCARSRSRSTANEIQATKFVVRESLL